MAPDLPTTNEHRGPVIPAHERRRPVLVCAFPRPVAIALPEGDATLGRSWLAEHGIPDTEVSARHVTLDRRGGTLQVADVGSRNGTWVDGARLGAREATTVEDGAVLRLGRTIFVYREGLPGSLEPAEAPGGLVGPFGLRAVTETIRGLSRDRTRNVLVEGETGVGKELVAREVAVALSREQPFAAVNVAGIPRGVFESQMFGHVAGAFSDARSASPGVVLAHDGGTLFLDEIGDLDLELQVKLLRLLENREVLPVGASRPGRVDVLVVAATNRDLGPMVERGAFRRDLFARLAMDRVVIPPLRERAEDLFAIVRELTRRAGLALSVEAVEVEAVERLMIERWPGNVRELDATLAATRRADPEPGLRRWAVSRVLGETTPRGAALTRESVEAALVAAGGNVTAAAASLGVTRGKLLRFRKRAPPG